jgi:hypothetical protein
MRFCHGVRPAGSDPDRAALPAAAQARDERAQVPPMAGRRANATRLPLSR